MTLDEGTLLKSLPESATQCAEKTVTASRYEVLFDSHDYRRIGVTLNGHKVVGGGYTGDLQCTGLTHWCEHPFD